MEPLLGKTQDELITIARNAGLQAFVGKQLCEWIYKHGATSFDAMTNISRKARSILEAQYIIGRVEPTAQAISEDGTRKYLFPVCTDLPQRAANTSAQVVECVYLPEADRATLCVSTQAGCKMRCAFCMTGTLGFHGNLTAADILNQILYFFTPNSPSLCVRDGLRCLTNLVMMGEGEPMDNIEHVLRTLNVLTADWGLAWSGKRITVSTVGIRKNLERFLNETDCHLAISLHNAFPAERATIMPAERLNAISEVLHLVRQYDWTHQRRLSFEYICWGGHNDDIPHAKQLIRLVQGLPCRVNLIRFHSIADPAHSSFPTSDEQRMIAFRDYLSAHGIICTIRRSRGEDILAACGMLVNALEQTSANHSNLPNA